MNNDLISREALKKETKSFTDCDGFNPVWQIIDNVPTVDLDERDNDAFETGYIKGLCENRPTGKWLKWEDERWGGVWHYCSNCRRDALCDRVDGIFKQVLSDFCPHCGAKMKGGAE